MQVILLQKVENLGTLGNVVNVKPGYARNYLVPTGRAKMATKSNLEAFEQKRAELEVAAAETLAKAEALREQIQTLTLTVKANVGSEGKLFGSVSNNEIAEALQAAGIEVERRNVRMPNGPIRNLGEHEVTIHLHTDVDATLKVVVEAE